MEVPSETTEEAVSRLRKALGELPRVCVLGGVAFRGPDSEELVVHIAQELSKTLGTRAMYVTGGMPGVQATFVKHCSQGAIVRNLVPHGHDSNYDIGEDIRAGKDMEQRKDIFGLIGDIYITVEGGPGVSQEARLAVGNGASVVPLIRTGGASEGMFDFPPQALERPCFCEERQWDLFKDKEAAVSDAASAAVAVVEGLVKRLEERTKKSTDSSPKKAVEPSQGSLPAPAQHLKVKLLQSIFKNADADGSGDLDKKELEALLQHVDHDLNADDISRIFGAMDVDASGSIDLKEFLAWVNQGSSENKGTHLQSTFKSLLGNDADALKVAFKLMDISGTGKVSVEELRQRLGEVVQVKMDAEDLLKKMDADHSGVVDFDEFLDAGDIDYNNVVVAIMTAKARDSSEHVEQPVA